MQYNKRDCDQPMALGIIERRLKLERLPLLESVATEGDGVMETIRIACRHVVQRFEV
jgi:hypothetical protein